MGSWATDGVRSWELGVGSWELFKYLDKINGIAELQYELYSLTFCSKDETVVET